MSSIFFQCLACVCVLRVLRSMASVKPRSRWHKIWCLARGRPHGLNMAKPLVCVLYWLCLIRLYCITLCLLVCIYFSDIFFIFFDASRCFLHLPWGLDVIKERTLQNLSAFHWADAWQLSVQSQGGHHKSLEWSFARCWRLSHGSVDLHSKAISWFKAISWTFVVPQMLDMFCSPGQSFGRFSCFGAAWHRRAQRIVDVAPRLQLISRVRFQSHETTAPGDTRSI